MTRRAQGRLARSSGVSAEGIRSIQASSSQLGRTTRGLSPTQEHDSAIAHVRMSKKTFAPLLKAQHQICAFLAVYRNVCGFDNLAIAFKVSAYLHGELLWTIAYRVEP